MMMGTCVANLNSSQGLLSCGLEWHPKALATTRPTWLRHLANVLVISQLVS